MPIVIQKTNKQTKPNPDFACSDLLHPHRDEVPSRPENPPVLPLLQPYLPLQGELIGDNGGDDTGYFASHSEGSDE